MKKNRMWLFLCATVGVCLVASTAASAGITAYGEVTDPVGDSLAASADLTFASVSITSTGDAIFRAIYAPGYDPATTTTTFTLDIDRDPSTGQSWLGMGVEAAVGAFGTGFQATGFYWFPAIPSPWPSLPATYLPDGIEIAVPLNTLGSSDGLINFNVASQVQLEMYVFTPIADGAPDYDWEMRTIGVETVRLIPAPGAILLGGIGISLVGWLRQRRTL